MLRKPLHALHLWRLDIHTKRRDLHALLEAAGRIMLSVIALLQESKARKTYATWERKHSSFVEISSHSGGVGSLVHPSVVHLVGSYEILSFRLATTLTRPHRRKPTITTNRYSSATDETEPTLFYLDLDEVIRNEKSFYKLVVGEFNSKIGMAVEEDYRLLV